MTWKVNIFDSALVEISYIKVFLIYAWSIWARYLLSRHGLGKYLKVYFVTLLKDDDWSPLLQCLWNLLVNIALTEKVLESLNIDFYELPLEWINYGILLRKVRFLKLKIDFPLVSNLYKTGASFLLPQGKLINLFSLSLKLILKKILRLFCKQN